MPLQVQYSESAGFDLHEADEWYDGLVVAIEETDGVWGPGLKWIIELDDDEPADNGDPRETWAFCSQKLSPRSKLYAWIKAIDQTAIPEPGGVLDLEQFVGARVQAMFEHYMGDIDGNEVEKEKVVKLRAAKAAKARPKNRRQKQNRDDDPVDEGPTPY